MDKGLTKNMDKFEVTSGVALNRNTERMRIHQIDSKLMGKNLILMIMKLTF